MMQMKIDKKVAMPEPRYSWPLSELEVGYSFEVPPGKESSLRAAIHNYAAANGVKFTVRKQEDGTRRCWRVE